MNKLPKYHTPQPLCLTHALKAHRSQTSAKDKKTTKLHTPGSSALTWSFSMEDTLDYSLRAHGQQNILSDFLVLVPSSVHRFPSA